MVERTPGIRKHGDKERENSTIRRARRAKNWKDEFTRESRMSEGIDDDRRRLLSAAAVGMAAAGSASLFPTQVRAAIESEAIRPFHVEFPEKALVELRQRL